MKKVLYVTLVLLSLIAAYIFSIFHATGYFRNIENFSRINILKKVNIPGVEDITISYSDNFALLSSDDRAARRDGNPHQGGLYFLNLKDPKFSPYLISGQFGSVFNPHGISLFRIDSAVYKVFVVNHVNKIHSIEVFKLWGDSLLHIETLKDDKMISPNDVVAVNENQFYFTNDHGYTSGMGVFLENYLGLAVSNVIFFDGHDYIQMAEGIAYANGINYDPAIKQLYVASPRGFKIKTYKVLEDFKLVNSTDILIETGVDNIEIDPDGNLWIGAHPNLLAFSAYAAGKREKAPSEVIKIIRKSQNDYSIEKILLDNGNLMSASSVSATFNDIVLIGNVMDNHFLITQLK